MTTNLDEPDSPVPASAPVPQVSPWAAETASALVPGETRHDGWTGERMAVFCEVLGDTGLVVDACLAAGKSTNTAYATRRRNPIFAAVWDAALAVARERLAHTLLARSIEGSVEQYFKDGELVGEKRVIDNRLGLAILRRLDRLAETGTSLHSNFLLAPVRADRRGTATPSSSAVDWDLALSALRSGDPDSLAAALAMLKGGEAHEAHDPPNRAPTGELGNAAAAGDAEEDYAVEDDDPTRVWCDEGTWYTDFAPPLGYIDFEKGAWGDYGYKRLCTREESRMLEAEARVHSEVERTADEAARDAWFAELKADLDADGIAWDRPGIAESLEQAGGGD